MSAKSINRPYACGSSSIHICIYVFLFVRMCVRSHFGSRNTFPVFLELRRHLRWDLSQGSPHIFLLAVHCQYRPRSRTGFWCFFILVFHGIVWCHFLAVGRRSCSSLSYVPRVHRLNSRGPRRGDRLQTKGYALASHGLL